MREGPGAWAARLEGRAAKGLIGCVVLAGALGATLGGGSEAAYYHDLARNQQPCSDCHTLHYSESGTKPAQVEAGGPFGQLKIRATTNKLCLFCHDGSDPKVPDVISPAPMYDGSGDEHSGAGFFANSGTAANPNGHDLGLPIEAVPFSSLRNVTLTCASCHDPHGTPNYRNLLTAPAGGTGTGLVTGTDVFRQVPPGDPPSAGASVAAYKESNEGYKAKASLWCTECHDQLKPSVNNPTDRKHHFVDVAIDGAGYPTDPTHWVGGTGSGFGDVTGDQTEGVPRLRYQVPGATDYASARTVAAGNQVMCTTCHLAHGGKYPKGLVWPYREAGEPVDRNSGCQQCHNF
ncbi:MAG: hypothetical protein HY900_16035 [Deltaproteobacteria bacterium]|nr:hypothetical protein [Deltaproteobacteria bacterium]